MNRPFNETLTNRIKIECKDYKTFKNLVDAVYTILERE